MPRVKKAQEAKEEVQIVGTESKLVESTEERPVDLVQCPEDNADISEQITDDEQGPNSIVDNADDTLAESNKNAVNGTNEDLAEQIDESLPELTDAEFSNLTEEANKSFAEPEQLESSIFEPDPINIATDDEELNDIVIDPPDEIYDTSISEPQLPIVVATEKPKPRRKISKKAEAQETEVQSSEELFPTDPIDTQNVKPIPSRRKTILTIDHKQEAATQENREEVVWHEIQNSYFSKRMLTGTLGGMEPTEAGGLIVIVYYKDFRVAIPVSEMMLNIPQGNEYRYGDLAVRQRKIINNMLGADVDFVVRGIDQETKSAIASRKDAMIKKRQIFYATPDEFGEYRVSEGRIVEARVIAVAQKIVRVEVFGVECSILARDLSWEWIGDAHERYSVGDKILVRILSVNRDDPANISIKCDVRSVSNIDPKENLKKCRIQGKYAGVVTDIHKGTIFVRLNIGVNAIAHMNLDRRMVGKKDEVSVAVTRLDEEHNVAVGIITRIIRQNI